MTVEGGPDGVGRFYGSMMFNGSAGVAEQVYVSVTGDEPLTDTQLDHIGAVAKLAAMRAVQEAGKQPTEVQRE